jgi:hypothetical protein
MAGAQSKVTAASAAANRVIRRNMLVLLLELQFETGAIFLARCYCINSFLTASERQAQ